jgi:hypothetical protein
VLDVPLGHERDQLATKALPDFVNLRTEVLAEIRTQAAPASEAES